MAEREFEAGRNLIMLSADHWHPGVLGIVASRIKELFHRPAALVAVDKESGKARVSLRSIEGIDLVAAMRHADHRLESYGGHTAAAGMTLMAEHLAEVHDTIDKAIGEQITHMPSPILKVDATTLLPDLYEEFAQDLPLLAPFGSGNPEPLLVVRNLRCVRRRVLGNKHLRVQLRSGDMVCEAIGFSLAEQQSLLRKPIDVALTPRITMHRGEEGLELQLKDIRPAGLRDDEAFGTVEGPAWEDPEEAAEDVS